jgi:DNA polymerase-4
MGRERVIFLVDMNAFFIACEMARNPELKGKPAAVAGDPKKRTGIVLTANYEARKYKVKTTMLIHEARRLCPSIVFVPPDHKHYEKMSKEVMNILSEYSPVIQQNSIDEAWMDMTGCEALFGKPVDAATKIMKDIMDRLDLWCSIGISENKFLAKMASELKKPLGITELWKKDLKDKLWPLCVREMYGIGKQTEKTLQALGMYTIGDIAVCDAKLLGKVLGKRGIEIHKLANGEDYSFVTENPECKNKSVSRSTTLKSNTTDLEYAKTVLMTLSEEVGTEARKKNYKGKTVSIVIKYSDFKILNRQKSMQPTYLTKDIYNIGVELLGENWNASRPVRLIGIALTNICDEAEQISIFDMSGGQVYDSKDEKLEKAVDTIRERFGADAVKRAKVLKNGVV